MNGSVTYEGAILSGNISINAGGTLEELEVTENGVYTPDQGVDGFSKVTVDVPDPVIQSKSITENGTYVAPEGVDGYSPITVNVPAYVPVIESKSITENGTYTAPSGVDGYSPITVNVPAYVPVIESKSITENGTYTAPSGVDGYSPITVNVPAGATIVFNEQNTKLCDASDGMTGWQAITTPLVSGHYYVVAIKDATWHSNNIYYGLLIKDSSTDSIEMTISDYTITLEFQSAWVRLDSKSLSANMDMYCNIAEVVSDYGNGLGA